jgi:hypothetical protein
MISCDSVENFIHTLALKRCKTTNTLYEVEKFRQNTADARKSPSFALLPDPADARTLWYEANRGVAAETVTALGAGRTASTSITLDVGPA